MTLHKWSQIATADATADSTINWAEGQSPSSVNDSARGMMAALAKWRDDITGISTTGGSGSAYTISSSQVIASNTNGFTVQFTPGVTNTGAVTLSVDGNTVIPLRFLTGVELLAGTLISGSLYQATYRAASSEWLLHSFDARIYLIPLGGMVDYFGTTAPTGAFALPYGQAINRTTYATLFSLIGTTFGSGDGSTTFNIPDLRGRIPVGKDDMGGSAANRVTTAGGGVDGATLGAVGGAQSVTLITANLPAYTPAGSVSVTSTASNVLRGANAGGISFQGGSSFALDGIVLSSLSAGSIASTGTLTGAAQGGTSVAVKTMPASIVCNKILRVL